MYLFTFEELYATTEVSEEKTQLFKVRKVIIVSSVWVNVKLSKVSDFI
jgi:hypothetical protein